MSSQKERPGISTRAVVGPPEQHLACQVFHVRRALAALPCSERDTPRRAAVWVLCAWAAQLGLAAFAGLITQLP